MRDKLEAAWEAIHHGGYGPENERDTCRLCDRFRRLLDAEAWLDAAMMLVPEDVAIERLTLWPAKTSFCNLYGTHLHKGEWWHNHEDGRWEGKGDTPAEALLAAILKAKEQDTNQENRHG